MQHESIALSRQMMTVILEHVRISKEYLRRNAAITYNDLLVLLALQEAGEPVGAGALADYAILQRRTVAAMLQEMQKAGLVARTSSEDDGRVMPYSITREGSAVARQCSADLSARLDEGILLGLDKEEAAGAIRGGEHPGSVRLPSGPSPRHDGRGRTDSESHLRRLPESESTPIPLTPFMPPSSGLLPSANWPLRTQLG